MDKTYTLKARSVVRPLVLLPPGPFIRNRTNVPLVVIWA